MDFHTAIHRYYRAFRERDRDALRSALTPDFHFVSAFGEFRERDTMLEAIWPSVGRAWATNLRIFGEGPEFVVLYDHETSPDAERPPMAMAEHLRFEGDRLAHVEVFVGRSLGAAT